MAKKNLPPIERLQQLLRYDRDAGVLYWRERAREDFSNPRCAGGWNARNAGRTALNNVNNHGYKVGCIDGKVYSAHRVCWAIAFNEDPGPALIDHINGNKTDNRLKNLRAVNHEQSGKNKPRPQKNGSGVVGVAWREKSKRWEARIGHRGKLIHLGTFVSFGDAVAARKAAEQNLGFHSNHGR